jgi:hypothetical protein
MSPAVLERPATGGLGRLRPTGRGPELGLEQRLAVALAAAQAGEVAACPVCSGPMELADGHARCGECGSRLS